MSNFEMMRKRLEWQGGIAQEDRMIKDKWRTLLRTLKYSYQACDIALAQAQQEVLFEGAEPEYPIVRALINPDKNKQDYDDKIILMGLSPAMYLSGRILKHIGLSIYNS